jgi:hypothetical protein
MIKGAESLWNSNQQLEPLLVVKVPSLLLDQMKASSIVALNLMCRLLISIRIISVKHILDREFQIVNVNIKNKGSLNNKYIVYCIFLFLKFIDSIEPLTWIASASSYWHFKIYVTYDSFYDIDNHFVERIFYLFN